MEPEYTQLRMAMILAPVCRLHPHQLCLIRGNAITPTEHRLQGVYLWLSVR